MDEKNLDRIFAGIDTLSMISVGLTLAVFGAQLVVWWTR